MGLCEKLNQNFKSKKGHNSIKYMTELYLLPGSGDDDYKQLFEVSEQYLKRYRKQVA